MWDNEDLDGVQKPGSIDENTLFPPAHGRKKPGFEEWECVNPDNLNLTFQAFPNKPCRTIGPPALLPRHSLDF